MRALGVDPGLTRCGVGIVDSLPGRRVQLVHVEVVRTPPSAELGARLTVIHRRILALIDQFEPNAVAVERVFARSDVSTVMGTAQAGGVAVLAASLSGLPVEMHTPSEVKSAVTGSGRADKAQVTNMVTRLLGLPQAPTPADAADALALAICHLWRGTQPAGVSSRPLTTAQQQWAAARRHAAGAPPAGR